MTSCDETDRSRAAITAAFEAWRHDGACVTDCFAPAMTWRIEGYSAASRAYENKREIIDEVLAPFNRRFSTSLRVPLCCLSSHRLETGALGVEG